MVGREGRNGIAWWRGRSGGEGGEVGVVRREGRNVSGEEGGEECEW